MKGRNTRSGNHAGHDPFTTPEMPNAAARNPSGTAPTSPRNIVAGGQLTARNGTIAAASASRPGAEALPSLTVATSAPAPYAPNPSAPIVAASPSVPSMKL